MSFYTRYPPSSGSGSGGVTSLDGMTGALTLVAGAGISIIDGSGTITITNTGITPTGDPDSYAGFDDAGNLFTIPGHNFHPDTFGDNIGLDAPYSGGSGYDLNDYNYNLIPSADSPDTSVNINQLHIDIDPTSQGFTMGTNGTLSNIYATTARHHGTSDTGNLLFFNTYADIGNGTDPITMAGIDYYSAFGDFNSGATISGQIQGYGFNVNIHAGATLDQGVRPFFDNANIAIAVPGHESFSANPQIAEIETNNNMNAFTANGQIPLFTGTASYTGLGVFPSLGTMNTGSFQGININPTITNANSAYIAGLNISMSNVAGITGDLPFTINAQNGRSQISSIATGSQSGNNFGADLDTANFAISPGQPYGLNNLGGQLHVAAGFPISNTFGFGNNLGSQLQIEDDVGPDPLTGTLGFSLNGFVNQVAVSTGKTMDTLNYMLAGGSVPDIGQGVGSITNVNMFAALGMISAGGSVNVTNMVGFHVQSTLSGLTPTNTWGIRVDDTAADNYFAKSLAVGTSSMKPANDSVGLELDSVTKSFLPSRMTQAQRDGLTAVDGMILYNTDTTTLQGYQNGVWGDLGAGTGGGANVTLSNLTSPTAINQDLTFAFTGSPHTIRTGDGSPNSDNFLLKSGDATAGASGLAALSSGNAAGGSQSGTVAIFSGQQTDQTNSTGGVQVFSSDTGSTFSSGSVTVQTGASVDGVSGTISMNSGSSSGAGASGDINISSGGAAATGATGAINLGSGINTGSNASGALTLFTGASVDSPSGIISILSGATSGAGNTGEIDITTGSPSGAGASGAISILTGQVTAAVNGGGITIATGGGVSTQGGSGDININTGNGLGSQNAGNISVLAGTGHAGNAGNIAISSGPNVAGGNGGTISLVGGDASGTGGTGGTVSIIAGGNGDNTGGDVVLATSNMANGTVGNIILEAGQNNSAVFGTITFQNGTQGTAGSPWVSTNTTGAGAWFAGPSGSFTTVDLKTVTIVNGIITSII